MEYPQQAGFVPKKRICFRVRTFSIYKASRNIKEKYSKEQEMNREILIVLTLSLFLMGCNTSPEKAATLHQVALTLTPKLTIPAPSVTPSTTNTAIPTVTTTPYPTPDMTQRPLIWFAPLPPLSKNEWRPYTGAEDFMDLFEPDAAWTQAADRIHVFKLYGEWVGDDPWTVHASNAELQQVILDLNRRGIALAMEAGPLDATSVCGQGIEGFGGG
jgi:hypothetical protein